MATNSVEICNSALTLIGTRKIVALSDPSVEARECNANYDICRKAVLRDHPWNFAVKRVVLSSNLITNAVSSAGLIKITSASHGRATNDLINISQVQGTNEANGVWTITVTSANDFTLNGSTFTNTYVSGGIFAMAAVFEFGNQFVLPTDFIRIHTVLDIQATKMDPGTYADEGGYLLTDQTTLWLKYVWNITDTTKFDSLFDLAMASKLAAMIAFKVTGSESTSQRCEKEYQDLLQKAKFTDSVEEPAQLLDDDEWLRARWGRGDWVRDPRTN